MTEQAFPAARTAAPAIAARFARLQETAARAVERELGPLPDEAAVEALLQAAFWASLRREEGRVPRISIALVPPEQVPRPLTFGQRIPVSAVALNSLAPAVGRPGIHLGVWHDDQGLAIWGATRSIPAFGFVLEVSQPGLLVVKHRRADPTAKFGNVLVLDGDTVKLVDEGARSLPDYFAFVGAESALSRLDTDSFEVLADLALSMRAHGHGGTLLVVPHGAETWRESILTPAPYAVAPPYGVLAELVGEEPVGWTPLPRREAYRRAVDGVAGLTAVDGAAMITSQYHLLAFGMRIERAPGRAPVESVLVTEPLVGYKPRIQRLATLGGMRHTSAAQFVCDQPDALALTASQDGRFTVFARSTGEGQVCAHRVEALLL